MKRLFTAIATTGALMISGQATAISEHPLAVDVKQLHPDAALYAAREAMEACRAEGLQVSVVVVDRRSVELIRYRDVVAPAITLSVAHDKAVTANEFTSATSDLRDLHDSPLAHQANMFLDAGGVPIESAGRYYGAIGVAGAPTQEQDEACARAGANALQMEMDLNL